MKDKMLVRIVLVILGSAVMGLSINLLVAAGFGLDPLSLFQAGLCNVFHISLGQASQLLMTGIIIILFFLDRKRIGIGSILNSILVGAFVNFFAAGFPAGAHVPLWGRLLSAAGGFLFMGMGIGIDPAEDLQIIAAIHSGRLLQLCGKSLKIVLDNNHVKWIYRSRQP